jgi:glycosyltransferase involved in cell wall biosynthesis
MNVLSIVMGSDPAGISGGIARAFRDEPGWSVRSLTSKQNYIEYPPDLPWERQVVIDAWQAADVVHLHHGFVTADRMVRGQVGRRVEHKPYVVEHHGTIFREMPAVHVRELQKRGSLGVVSTIDLHLVSGLEWLPPPVDVRGLKMTRQEQQAASPEAIGAELAGAREPARVLISHAPTNRGVKSTDEFLKAVKRLQDEGYPVDLDLIEHRPWAECLERKAKADIYFDQVILGYGCNALEAWGMGIPVVAGAADETLDEMERRFGHLPFYHATEETIYDALKELVESPELRAEYGRIGHEYVKRYHDEPVVVEQLKGLYQRAIEGQENKAA